MNEISIIRRGNHFIRDPRNGYWILIDGPWFRYLNSLGWTCKLDRPGTSFVYVQRYREPLVIASPTDGRPIIPYDDMVRDCLVWERVQYHPGYLLPRPAYELPQYWKWQEWQSSRKRFGWQLPDGRLPAYINQVEFEEDIHEHNWVEGIDVIQLPPPPPEVIEQARITEERLQVFLSMMGVPPDKMYFRGEA